jgi:hypothetical protein
MPSDFSIPVSYNLPSPRWSASDPRYRGECQCSGDPRRGKSIGNGTSTKDFAYINIFVARHHIPTLVRQSTSHLQLISKRLVCANWLGIRNQIHNFRLQRNSIEELERPHSATLHPLRSEVGMKGRLRTFPNVFKYPEFQTLNYGSLTLNPPGIPKSLSMNRRSIQYISQYMA